MLRKASFGRNGWQSGLFGTAINVDYECDFSTKHGAPQLREAKQTEMSVNSLSVHGIFNFLIESRGKNIEVKKSPTNYLLFCIWQI